MDLTWLSSWKEVAQFGANEATFWFVLVIVLTVSVNVPAMLVQLAKLWPSTAEADGVSATMMLINTGYFVAFIKYSFANAILGGFINGTCLVLFYPMILVRVWRIRGFTPYEWLAAIICAGIVAATALPYTNELYAIASIVGAASIGTQPLQMFLKKSSAGASAMFLFLFTATSATWILYALSVRDWFVFPVAVSLTVFFGLGWILCHWYRPKADKQVVAA